MVPNDIGESSHYVWVYFDLMEGRLNVIGMTDGIKFWVVGSESVDSSKDLLFDRFKQAEFLCTEQGRCHHVDWH